MNESPKESLRNQVARDIIDLLSRKEYDTESPEVLQGIFQAMYAYGGPQSVTNLLDYSLPKVCCKC